MRPWKLSELNYSQVKKHSFEVAVVPIGCTEPHNLHLPYGMDTFESEIIGDHICEAAHDAGASVLLLPAIPYSTVSAQSEFPFSINIYPSTLSALLTDIIESLSGHGIRKIILLNSHGGNDLKPLLRELYGEVDAHLFLFNWYESIKDVYSEIFERQEDHAGEMETSIALAYFPELVARTDSGELAADDGTTTRFRFEALNNGWVSITRPWHLYTVNSGAGNPHAATAEKGRRLMEVLVERMSAFIVELSESEIDQSFPFVSSDD